MAEDIVNSWRGCQLYKYGKLIVLHISVKTQDGTDFTGNNKHIMTLPKDCRPLGGSIFTAGIGTDYHIKHSAYLYIATTGTVAISPYSGNTGSVVHAVVAFIAA